MEIDSFVSCTVITKQVFRNNPSVAGVTVKNEKAAPGFDRTRHLLFQEVCEVLTETDRQVSL